MAGEVSRDGNTIKFGAMDHPSQANTFLRTLFDLVKKRGYSEILIDCTEVGRAFPNVIVPVAGIIDFYQDTEGVEFLFPHLPDFLSRCHFTQPMDAGSHEKALKTNPLNIVWRFQTAEDVNELGNEFVKAISQEVVCEEGVIDSIMWCINEVMDNVMVHSGKDYGFVMGQVHKQTRHISFCVYDNGQGIFNSLKNTAHAPASAIEAIEMSIQERVTRDRSVGQGNGMWGLSEIVKNNSGRLSIASGSGLFFRSNGNLDTRNDMTFLSSVYGACSVDFQLNYNKKVMLTEALKGHKPVNYRTENFEDEQGFVIYRLADAASGTGTRPSGKKIRNDMINLYTDSKRGIVIDFEGLSVISSSFADELVGKLLVHFGFFGFNQIVRLKNMNTVIQTIVERSVAQRMTESFT
jgi:anti-sigma regulatory factor (Ser/Thr protein kinase)